MSHTTKDGEAVPLGSAEHAYDVYGRSVDYKTFRGDPMPAFADLPDPIRAACSSVALTLFAAGNLHAAEGPPTYGDPVAESRQFRKTLDWILQLVKRSARQSRERSLAITKLEESIMWLGMDLKAQREEGVDTGPSPYPNSYDPSSDEPVSPTADGLTL